MMKNRTLNFNDFFACLQREYLVAELRHKIYMKVKDKEYYLHKEMEGKKKTIESIASRNNFPSIFTDQWLFEKYKSEIYNEWGLPNFIYRSDEDRTNRRPSDIISYFHRGVIVNVKTDEGVKPGRVVWTDLDNSTVTVEVSGHQETVPYDNLQRKF